MLKELSYAAWAGVLIAGLSGSQPANAAEVAEQCDGWAATITGTDGADTITGTEGPDIIWAGAGDDVVNALGGNDVVCGGSGRDTIDGGTWSDLLYGDDGADNLIGGVGVDRLYGQAGADHLPGGDGNDYLEGGDGNDELDGDAGADRLYGNGGADYLDAGFDNGQPDKNCGAFCESLTGGAGDDTLDGSTGNAQDVVDYDEPGLDIQVDLRTGVGDGEGHDVLISIEAVYVTASGTNDRLIGSSRDEDFYSASGKDVIKAGGGDDIIRESGGEAAGAPGDVYEGGAGNDEIVAVDGDDRINAGPGNDHVSISGGGDAGPRVRLEGGDDVLDAYGVSSSPVLMAWGGGGNDRLWTHSGYTSIFYGGAGSDDMASTDPDDTLDGGPDTDTGEAGAGWDTCTSIEVASGCDQ